ncbi:DUF5343 domain-containing protein [Sphingomonas sp. AOB5]|uniref:DUF5343 domain-containing protein n=1 Tax=Sphingomonas sp. AOB5 TaxID=3034017 RepID=UPI0023F67E43|nr:DUF5343 domain-containing protein [Sphingomonas sp. AOB5]MDF7776943.1 DUF5343 domain-containing protein [Sphingomonas sp. AOB5]
MNGFKNVPNIMQRIVSGAAPDKFNLDHLQGLGFKSSGDRAIIPILKDLGFLTSDGSPTPRYHLYRDPSKSAQVLGEALREAYGDLFLINDNLTAADRPAIIGKFKSSTNSTDKVAELQTATFLGLLKMADISKSPKATIVEPLVEEGEVNQSHTSALGQPVHSHNSTQLDLRYTIQVHLPATKDIEVFNAIFKSLRANLLD